MLEIQFSEIMIKEINRPYNSLVDPSTILILDILSEIMGALDFQETSKILCQIDFKNLLLAFSSNVEIVIKKLFSFLIFCMILRETVWKILLKNDILIIILKILMEIKNYEIIKFVAICFHTILGFYSNNGRLVNNYNPFEVEEINATNPLSVIKLKQEIIVFDINDFFWKKAFILNEVEEDKHMTSFNNFNIKLFLLCTTKNSFIEKASAITKAFFNNDIFKYLQPQFKDVFHDNVKLEEILKFFVNSCKRSYRLKALIVEIFQKIGTTYIIENNIYINPCTGTGLIFLTHLKLLIEEIDDFLFYKLTEKQNWLEKLFAKFFERRPADITEKAIVIIDLITIIWEKAIKIKSAPIYESLFKFFFIYHSILIHIVMVNSKSMSQEEYRKRIDLSNNLREKWLSSQKFKFPILSP